MKYILKENNYFSHIGTDPVENSVPLDFDNKFSVNNTPTKFHYWNGEEFVLDADLYKSSLIDQVQEMVCSKCDALKLKIVQNESYAYSETYESVKEELLMKLKMQRARLTTFDELTIAELEEITC